LAGPPAVVATSRNPVSLFVCFGMPPYGEFFFVGHFLPSRPFLPVHEPNSSYGTEPEGRPHCRTQTNTAARCAINRLIIYGQSVAFGPGTREKAEPQHSPLTPPYDPRLGLMPQRHPMSTSLAPIFFPNYFYLCMSSATADLSVSLRRVISFLSHFCCFFFEIPFCRAHSTCALLYSP